MADFSVMSRGRRWTKEMKERTFYKFAGRVMKVEYILGVLIRDRKSVV